MHDAIWCEQPNMIWRNCLHATFQTLRKCNKWVNVWEWHIKHFGRNSTTNISQEFFVCTFIAFQECRFLLRLTAFYSISVEISKPTWNESYNFSRCHIFFCLHRDYISCRKAYVINYFQCSGLSTVTVSDDSLHTIAFYFDLSWHRMEFYRQILIR